MLGSDCMMMGITGDGLWTTRLSISESWKAGFSFIRTRTPMVLIDTVVLHMLRKNCKALNVPIHAHQCATMVSVDFLNSVFHTYD